MIPWPRNDGGLGQAALPWCSELRGRLQPEPPPHFDSKITRPDRIGEVVGVVAGNTVFWGRSGSKK